MKIKKYKRRSVITMIKAVIFDMDGTMLDTEHIKEEGLKHAGKCLNVNIDNETLTQIRGTNNKRLKEILCSKFEGLDVQKLLEIREKYVEAYFENHPIETKKGLLELLEFLKNHEYKMAVASSSNLEVIKKYLKKVEVLDYFDIIMGGDLVTKGKPDPEIYLKCLERLGLSEEECIGVEDTANGVLSIHKAGMKPIMIPDLEEPSKEVEQVVYAKLESLLDVILLLKEMN